ncbi:A/G-specific adenine glycosylase [Pricia sp. S334]|uniref:Adenine DNA glycosylase n=1 Tax=Pricia mediterranea TaxID=3076079 RepID=A0ABU3L615_9FLAO|nr:A/G-specific adenine glycosylase [Pricia sp. S334]MDT7829175.1 A/G-specific adenine glycosylase [Pricia sp. S334]
MSFAKKILTWYAANKRSLPWRGERDPYRIWLSEIILQQTRVAQGTPYYLKFLSAFPTVYDLANAPEERVLKLWQGLGYYSRARNLHSAAKTVVGDMEGVFPSDYKGLRKLKGVGDYTASAIASICFNLPEPVVDGNVYRVLARYFGVELPITSSEGIKYFKSLAREVMDGDNIREYNQGIMEFGAIQCVPKSPNCTRCPLKASCTALQQGRILELPVKAKKAKVRHRHFNYLYLEDVSGKTLLQQRTKKGIWQNLWEFPLIESDKNITEEALVSQLDGFLDAGKVQEITRYNDSPVVHKLSHQHLHTVFWMVKTDEILENGIPWSDVHKYPVPVLIADFFAKIRTFEA